MISSEFDATVILPSETGEVYPQSLFASSDSEVIFDFYVPLIGYKAAYAYFVLTKIEPHTVFTHSLIAGRYELPLSDFALSLNRLAAVGLIKIYVKEERGKRSFRYSVYAPEPPSSFFGETVFAKNLSARLSQEDRRSLKRKYLVKSPLDSDEGYKEIPMDFSWFYDFSDREIDPAELLDDVFCSRSSARPYVSFDFAAFQNALTNECPDYPVLSFGEKDIAKLGAIASLYDLSPEAMASLFARRYAPERGRPVSLYEIEEEAKALQEREAELARRQVAGSSSHAPVVASALEKMDNTPSEIFLSRIQKHGGKPASQDLKLISSLREEQKLSDGAINALLAWVLTKEDMKLPAPYVRKIAASLSRKGCDNALDVLNYLKSPEASSFAQAESPRDASIPEMPSAPQADAPQTDDSDDDFDFDAIVDAHMKGRES